MYEPTAAIISTVVMFSIIHFYQNWKVKLYPIIHAKYVVVLNVYFSNKFKCDVFEKNKKLKQLFSEAYLEPSRIGSLLFTIFAIKPPP